MIIEEFLPTCRNAVGTVGTDLWEIDGRVSVDVLILLMFSYGDKVKLPTTLPPPSPLPKILFGRYSLTVLKLGKEYKCAWNNKE